MSGALSGVRVLDLSRVLAGPWATQLLADFGAEVIKIERPGTGDDTRHWGPPWLTGRDGMPSGESAYFLSTNRNKKSVTVDLSSVDGRQVIRDLAGVSDVLVDNFRVGTLARYELDAAALRERHPQLICCSITAYGQTGPRSGESGYDAMIQASAGLMSLTGDAHGAPQKTGVVVADIMAGMYAASAILAALNARHDSGVGQTIDVPLYDTQLAWLANQAMNYLVSGEVPERHGNGHPNIVPYQAFETADGYLMLAVGNDRQFASCVRCLGCAEFASDPRFSTNALRVENRSLLVERLAARFRTETTQYWIDEFARHDIPCGPINDLAAAFSDPQVDARGLLRSLPHPLAGQVPVVANPVRFSDTPAELRSAPPLLGEHTDSVLRELLGYPAGEIERLRAAGTV